MKEADILKYAALIQNDKGEILLGRKHGKDTWINIGGRVEGSETPLECLSREIKEELNCDINLDTHYQIFAETPATPALDDPNMTVKIVWYKIELIGIPTPSNEIEEVKWINPNEADNFKMSPQIVEYLIPELLKSS